MIYVRKHNTKKISWSDDKICTKVITAFSFLNKLSIKHGKRRQSIGKWGIGYTVIGYTKSPLLLFSFISHFSCKADISNLI